MTHAAFLIVLASMFGNAHVSTPHVLSAPAWDCSSRPLEQGRGNVRVCERSQTPAR
jgi:hypothetical protein